MSLDTKQTHSLVRTFTKPEKRRFKIILDQSNSQHKKLYSDLFDLLHRQDELDKEKLLRELSRRKGGNHFVKRFSYFKTQFCELLFETLVSISQQNSVNQQIHRLLELENIAEAKELPKLAKSLMEQARKLALKYQVHGLHVEIIHRLRNCYTTILPVDIDYRLNMLDSELNATILKLKREGAYKHAYQQIFVKYKRYHEIRNKEIIEEVLEILSQPLFQDPNQAITLYSKRMYHNAHIFYYRLIGDFEKMQKHQQSVVESWELHPELACQHPRKVRVSYANLLYTKHLNGNYEDWEAYLEKIEKLYAGSNTEKATAFARVVDLKLLKYINTARFDAAAEMIDEMNEGFDKFGAFIKKDAQINTYFNSAVALFHGGYYKKAKAQLEMILNIKGHNIRQDIMDFALVFQVILAMDMNEPKVFDYYLRSAKNRITNSERNTDFEQTCLQYLPKMFAAQDEGQMKEVAQAFLKELEQLEGKLLGISEVKMWLNTKINQTTFKNLILEKVEKQ